MIQTIEGHKFTFYRFRRRKGIVDNNRIPEREVMVRASYTEIIEPALEHCMKGAVKLPEMQRNPALTEEKRIADQAIN